MTKWFRSNHELADRSPYGTEEGGYLYPLADVRDELEGEFPTASETVLNRAVDELDAEGASLDRKATAARERDQEYGPR